MTVTSDGPTNPQRTPTDLLFPGAQDEALTRLKSDTHLCITIRWGAAVAAERGRQLRRSDRC
ncbi:hypothetical protein GCM10009547_34920 [Sporichthya brevicatena]|uniref:Uncharacterized protein n=1 Tax=Sporichthya brevicatena TaxID=171442 RepID=A0ABN1H420_9ACTN